MQPNQLGLIRTNLERAGPEVINASGYFREFSENPDLGEILGEQYLNGLAEAPARITIPQIQVDAAIEPVFTTDSGVMGTPTDPQRGGWYAQRARASEPGLSIINGHVFGGTAAVPGVFNQLHRLQQGANFSVEMSDGSIREFKVTANQSYSLAEAQEVLYNRVHERQLNLITCVGNYIVEQETFDRRQIVVAKAV